MEEFLAQKAGLFVNIKKIEEELENDSISIEECNSKMQEYADEYNDILHQVWKELMSLELTLYEQMEDVISNFEQALTEMINYFIENSQGYFTELRSLEQLYMENVSGEANNFITMATVQEDFFVPDELTLVYLQSWFKH